MVPQIVFIFLFLATALSAQRVENYEIPATGFIQLADDIAIPKINPGYTIWLPDNGIPKGLVVFLHARRDTVESDPLIDHALTNQLAVLYASTDNQLEFFFEVEKLQEIEGYLHTVLNRYNIPRENILYCGMSLGGTRVLKQTIFAQTDRSVYHISPRAIAICDAPLDMVRFHRSSARGRDLKANPAAANEGKWVCAYLEYNLGGTPEDSMDAYVEYAPYCYAAGGGPHLDAFAEVAVRTYTEPDVSWWMETRRKDYYDMNAIDMAALINALNIEGNEEAELIITHDKGYRPDGSRHPHSWNIVDEAEMIDWFLMLLDE